MIINKRRNKWMMAIVIVNILLTITLFLLNFNRVPLNWLFYDFLQAMTEITYILIILYLVSVLQLANESIAVQTPFNIFLGVAIIAFISGFFPSRQQNLIMIISVIGILNIIMTFYILVVTFKIKNKDLLPAFKIFSITQVLVMLLKISIPFVWVITTSQQTPISKYLGLISLLPVLIVFYIISKTQNIYVQHNHIENDDTLKPLHP
jgi:hypothetical protein